MSLQARTKKILAAVVVVALVAAGGLATVTALLVRDAPETLPTITAYAHGKTVDVEAGVCDSTMRCADLTVAYLPVPAGSPLQLSLPRDIAAGEWRLNVQFGDPRTGEVFEGYRDYTPDENYSVTVPTQENEQLLGVIIQQPSSRDFAPVWALQTLPDLPEAAPSAE
ncbi:DUF2771 family protein [Rhodococcus sp. NPDC058505]|uniref:DUF2771 family protein n=1 Tax=unclassified Rhodococcus (in: high G+C Gram-positive bacteria) TaxID=192944 RepID=UPI00364EDF05